MFGSQERRRCDSGGNKPHGSYFGTFRRCELSLQALTRPPRLSITRRLTCRSNCFSLTRCVNSPHHRRRLVLHNDFPATAAYLFRSRAPTFPIPVITTANTPPPKTCATDRNSTSNSAAEKYRGRALYGRPGNKAAFPAERCAHFAHRHAPSMACIVI